jgi:cell division protein FtsI/penicillin-binding protein 2
MFFKEKEKFDLNLFSGSRILILTLFIFSFSLVIIFRLFILQVIQNPFYSLMASERHEVYKNLFPNRGSIYVQEKDELYPLVTNRDYYFIYAEPNKIESPGKAIDLISPILGLAEEEWKDLLSRLNKQDDPYEPIKHKVTKSQTDEIEKLELAGIGFLPETYRFYPESGIGGHIFGFVQTNDEEKIGQYGLEGYFNKEMSGKSGLVKSVKDALGSLITVGQRSIEKAEDGSSLVLTIDRRVQFTACQKLKHFYDYFKAESGSVIIMEPTGAIIAMCSFPDFDPEKYNEVEDINYLNNPVIFHEYEPGSVFKPITMAAALEEGKISPQTTYEDTGELKIGPYTIMNFDNKAHGVKTMTEVLEESLNTGAMFAADLVGKDVFTKYVKDFGFGKNTGITLDTEVPGNISQLDKKGEIYYLTASFGQGLTATPLQLAASYAAIANNGILTKPYIVSEIIKPDGTKEIIKPQEIRQVISPRAASLLSGMLVSVVEKGYDKKAKVEGYYLAAKTGTAQVAGGSGSYGGKTIHTFIGYGPVSNPKFVMLLKLNNPQGIGFASDSLGPLFKQISEFLLNYYQIQPDY